MPEPGETPRPSPEDAPKPAPSNSEAAFQRAENLLTVENENRGQRGREAFLTVENSESADRAPDTLSDADALTQGITAEQSAPDDNLSAADAEKLAAALAEKAREGAVGVGNDTSRIGWDLTPHNL